jgi:hypothetical protein
MLGWTHTFDGGQINDLRAGWTRNGVRQPRPAPELPVIQFPGVLVLPGPKRDLDLRTNHHVFHLSNIFSVRRGRHSLTAGVEFRRNLLNGLTLGIEDQGFGRSSRFINGFYLFPNLASLGAGRPLASSIVIDRFARPFQLPDLRREYRSNEFSAFVQNDFKLSRRLSLNAGLRYEFYGVPHNAGPAGDANIYFGEGATFSERFSNATLRRDEKLHRTDWLNLAPSLAVAWDPFGKGATVFRGGYAVAYDRIFDSVRDVRVNTIQAVNCMPPGCTPAFVVPAAAMLPSLREDSVVYSGTLIHLDENLRTPYAQNWYAGVQQTLPAGLVLEVGHVGSVGRKLMSRDEVNRAIGSGRLNPNFGEIVFLSNAGNSNYLGLETSLERRFRRGLQLQISHTWSHAIDNQSDLLEGTRFSALADDFALPTFTRQFDARSDRGNANFDQRHNLVISGIWDVPAPRHTLLSGWSLSWIAAFRSGFPVTVIGSNSTAASPGLRANRADFIGGAESGGKLPEPVRVAGGVQWLDRSAFRLAPDHIGTLGRGAIAGPGFWNADAAVLKNFNLTERFRLQFRAEFYNVFNHANLSFPVTNHARPTFGQAYYGVNRTFSRFGDLPLEHPSRRIQFAMRLRF